MVPKLDLYSEWTTFFTDEDGEIFIEKNSIRKQNESVYWWMLGNLNQPDDENGMMSFTIYHQGDCISTQIKVLSILIYKKPMGLEVMEMFNEDISHTATYWEYIPSGDIEADLLDYVCEYVK
ncbi:MAG: hypothetical protein OSB31_11030 [Paracoccaceae bacterium]|nr:hypothetical protein [Paracoccaceae bacterium]